MKALETFKKSLSLVLTAMDQLLLSKSNGLSWRQKLQQETLPVRNIIEQEMIRLQQVVEIITNAQPDIASDDFRIHELLSTFTDFRLYCLFAYQKHYDNVSYGEQLMASVVQKSTQLLQALSNYFKHDSGFIELNDDELERLSAARGLQPRSHRSAPSTDIVHIQTKIEWSYSSPGIGIPHRLQPIYRSPTIQSFLQDPCLDADRILKKHIYWSMVHYTIPLPIPVYNNDQWIGLFHKTDKWIDFQASHSVENTRELCHLDDKLLYCFRGDVVHLILEMMNNQFVVQSGSVEALLDQVAGEPNQDMVFVDRFLSVYDFFVSSRTLFDNLRARYYQQNTLEGQAAEKLYLESRLKTQVKILNFFGFWAMRRPEVFVKNYTLGLDMSDMLTDVWFGGFKSESDRIRRTLLSRQLHHEKKMRQLSFLSCRLIEEMIQFDPKRIADYLFYTFHALLQTVTITDCILFLDGKPSDAYPSLTLLVNRSNQIYDWVSGFISKSEGAYELFIKTAHYCLENRDFNSCVMITCALQTRETPVSRKSRKRLEAMKQLSDPSQNHKNYRKLMEHSQIPFVPLVPVMLHDLASLKSNFKQSDIHLIPVQSLFGIHHVIQSNLRGSQQGPSQLNPDDVYFRALEACIQGLGKLVVS
ncbi:ras guanine nucleotide exchange factor domain-containing protein [Gorgonomyces haynaldii]|nr:ras guanine nucleotide exchange factor domain-containing protein [Gorgonomyces haynaldii]